MKTMTLLGALFLAGCSSSSGDTTASCDTRTTNQSCEDDSGPEDVVAPYQTACPSGSWSTSACNHSGSVGGCRTTDTAMGLTITDWFFAPETTDSVMAACQAPSTFVSP